MAALQSPSTRMPRRPGIEPPTRYQYALILALSGAGARLRKYGFMQSEEDKHLAGRAQVLAPTSGMDRALLPGYTAARLLRAGYVEVIDIVAHFSTHYTDYMLTDHGRRVVAAYSRNA